MYWDFLHDIDTVVKWKENSLQDIDAIVKKKTTSKMLTRQLNWKKIFRKLFQQTDYESIIM